MMYNIVIVGPRKCGKTSFLNRLNTGEFSERYLPTEGTNMQTISFKTDGGDIMVNFWDVSNENDYYFSISDAIILMGDYEESDHIINMAMKYCEVKKKYPKKNIIRCLNKCPLGYVYVSGKRKLSINVRSNNNVLSPILWALHDITEGKVTKINHIYKKKCYMDFILKNFEELHGKD